MIVWAEVILLSYVIRKNDAPDQIERNSWEEKSVLSVPLTGTLYKQDNLKVHNILLYNIADTSDGFTYVNPYIKKDDVRTDIKALCCKYENVAIQEQYISKAKRTIETIQYIKEIAMTFEKFVSKLVKAINELDKWGRGMNNAEIVKTIWKRVSNAELS